MTRTFAIAAAVVAVATTASSASAANSGPVGQWRLAEGAGATAIDSSGFGDNGALSGGVRWTSAPTGAALAFDGASGEVRIADAPQLEPSGAISIAAWVARSGTPGNFKYILAKGGHGCISASYGLYSGPSGGLEFYISRGHGTTYARSSDAGAGVWDGSWHLVVGTFDGTTIRLYVDGAQVGSGTVYPGPIEYLLSDTNDLFVGAYPSCPGFNFSGTISDVRVWNRALSAADMPALLSSDQQPPIGGGNPPSTAAPNAAAGNGTTSSGQAGGTGGGTASASPPAIHMATLSTTTFRLGAASAGRSAPSIIYTDSASSQVTFTILQVQSKQAQSRCSKTARKHHRSVIAYCPRLVPLGRFVHQDRVGRNVVKFPRRLTPKPGSYVLDVTPSLNGTVGKTVAIPFKVVATGRRR